MSDRWEHLEHLRGESESNSWFRSSLTVYRNITQRAAATFSIIVLGICLLILGGAVQESVSGIAPLLTLLYIGLFISGLLVVLSATTILFLRISKSTRETIEGYWESQTPPYDFRADSVSFSSLLKAHSELATNQDVKRIEPPDIEFHSTVSAIIYNSAYGLLFASGGVLLGAVVGDVLPTQSSEVGSSQVSVGVAIVSIILGRILGVFSLGIATFADQWGEVILIVVALGLPSIFVAPATRSLMDLSELAHENIFSSFTVTKELIARMLICSLYVLFFGYFVSELWNSW